MYILQDDLMHSSRVLLKFFTSEGHPIGNCFVIWQACVEIGRVIITNYISKWDTPYSYDLTKGDVELFQSLFPLRCGL